jgi:hypothetical protein
VRLGAIGVDFNIGFASVSETDRFGNIIVSQDVPMVTAGLSKHTTQTTISIAVSEIIAIACKAQKSISTELLDFAKKKAQLSYASPGRHALATCEHLREGHDGPLDVGGAIIAVDRCPLHARRLDGARSVSRLSTALDQRDAIFFNIVQAAHSMSRSRSSLSGALS